PRPLRGQRASSAASDRAGDVQPPTPGFRPGRRRTPVRPGSVNSDRDLDIHGFSDNGSAERGTGDRPPYPQVRPRFRWWWQVLGSNQRRLSRRFYSLLYDADGLNLPPWSPARIDADRLTLSSACPLRAPHSAELSMLAQEPRWMAPSASCRTGSSPGAER